MHCGIPFFRTVDVSIPISLPRVARHLNLLPALPLARHQALAAEFGLVFFPHLQPHCRAATQPAELTLQGTCLPSIREQSVEGQGMGESTTSEHGRSYSLKLNINIFSRIDRVGNRSSTVGGDGGIPL